jgi:hypothetical protein
MIMQMKFGKVQVTARIWMQVTAGIWMQETAHLDARKFISVALT